MKQNNYLKSARRTIRIEAKGLEKLAKSLDIKFNQVCDRLLKIKGKIITPVSYTHLTLPTNREV